MKTQLTENLLNELSQPLVKIIQEFYSESKNVEAFEKWITEKKRRNEMTTEEIRKSDGNLHYGN